MYRDILFNQTITSCSFNLFLFIADRPSRKMQHDFMLHVHLLHKLINPLHITSLITKQKTYREIPHYKNTIHSLQISMKNGS